MFKEHGPDDMMSEYPSCIEECFHNSLQGSYFKRELSKAREDKRVGLPLPHDPSRLVNTFWDIGMDDENCIWFHSTDGVRHCVTDSTRAMPSTIIDGDDALGRTNRLDLSVLVRRTPPRTGMTTTPFEWPTGVLAGSDLLCGSSE
jgi:hypothetical protein